MRAAVLRPDTHRLAIEDLAIEAPRAGEVLVRGGAAGICASDLHVIHEIGRAHV